MTLRSLLNYAAHTQNFPCQITVLGIDIYTAPYNIQSQDKSF